MKYSPMSHYEITQDSTSYKVHMLVIILTFIISNAKPESFIAHPDNPQAAAKERIRATNREDIILLSRGKSSQVGRSQIPHRHLYATSPTS